MESKHRYGIALGIALVGGLASVLAAPEVPQEMAIHWNSASEADNTASKTVALALLPAMSIAMLVLLAVLPRIDPLAENFREFRVAYDWFVVGVVAFLTYVHGIVLLVNVGVDLSIMQLIAPAVAALFVAVGFVLDRAERNWFVGIRTPWTLSDEQVWEQTHDRAAPMFKLAGVVALGAIVLPRFAIWFLVGPAVIIAVYTTAFSYFAYQRKDSPG